MGNIFFGAIKKCCRLESHSEKVQMESTEEEKYMEGIGFIWIELWTCGTNKKNYKYISQLFLEDGVKKAYAFVGGLSVKVTYILSGLFFVTGSFSLDGVHPTSTL